MKIIAILPRQKKPTKQLEGKTTTKRKKGKDCRANLKMYTDMLRLKQFQGTQFAHTKKVTLKILSPTCPEFFFA